MSTVRWWLTLKVYRVVRRLGARELAEWFSGVSGLRARLLSALAEASRCG